MTPSPSLNALLDWLDASAHDAHAVRLADALRQWAWHGAPIHQTLGLGPAPDLAARLRWRDGLLRGLRATWCPSVSVTAASELIAVEYHRHLARHGLREIPGGDPPTPARVFFEIARAGLSVPLPRRLLAILAGPPVLVGTQSDPLAIAQAAVAACGHDQHRPRPAGPAALRGGDRARRLPGRR